MSCPLPKILRQYTANDSFTKVSLRCVNEFHVVLSFARDYDENRNSTNGWFRAYWDTVSVTPAVIQKYKGTHGNKVKFFVAIGTRSCQYPLRIPDYERETWISNATESLSDIIREYHFDGIDIYYEHIDDTGTEDFVHSIGEVIVNLKTAKTINVASIATNETLNVDYYRPLYQTYGDYIDWVVYQIYDEMTPLRDVIGVVNRLIELSQSYNQGTLLSGGSFNSADWSKVSPVDYIIATIILIVFAPNIIAGASIWTGATDTQSDAAPQGLSHLTTA